MTIFISILKNYNSCLSVFFLVFNFFLRNSQSALYICNLSCVSSHMGGEYMSRTYDHTLVCGGTAPATLLFASGSGEFTLARGGFEREQECGIGYANCENIYMN